jgi:hypothetical protein
MQPATPQETAMKTATALFAAFAFAAVLVSASAGAAEKQLSSSQERMKTCNAEGKAKGLTGKEFTDFRNSCLKGDTTPAPPAKPMTQQEKMKACNAEGKAKGLTSKEFTDFRNNCLKGDTSATVPAPAH